MIGGTRIAQFGAPVRPQPHISLTSGPAAIVRAAHPNQEPAVTTPTHPRTDDPDDGRTGTLAALDLRAGSKVYRRGMDTLTIGQVAERTGFSASSLRYYEGIGLVVPAGRTASGYRTYDEATVARLSFVARAKQLGCTLEEIGDLLTVWDESSCGPVQRRFHDLVTEKIGATQQQLRELTAFADQLRTAAAHLSATPSDGPCDATCACLTAPEPVGPQPVAIACSLPADAAGDRTADWAAVLVHATERTPTPDGGLRLALDAETPLAELVRLVTAEQDCCAFLSFSITVDARGLALEVRAPAGAETLVDAVFGVAGGPVPVAGGSPPGG